VDARISPEPTESERRAIAAALASELRPAGPYAGRWRAAALDDLRGDDSGGDAAAQELRGDAGIVEP
jgi:hypothetical protein